MSLNNHQVAKPLSDPDWKRLQDSSGLPDGARRSVDEIIQFLREKPSQQHPRVTPTQQTRKAITSAKKQFSRLSPILDTLIKTRAYNFLVRPLELGPHNNASGVVVSCDELTRFRAEIRAYAGILTVAEKEVPKFKVGRHMGHLGEVIRALNRVMLDSTGKAMNTAKRRTSDNIDFVAFVRMVTAKAEMKFEDSTIKNEIKENNPFRRKRRHKA